MITNFKRKGVLLVGALALFMMLCSFTEAFAKDMVNLDFQDADIKDVIKSISEITGKNFILDDRIRGRVTIISPTPVTVDEAYQAFISALELKNYTVIKTTGRTYKVVPSRVAKSSPITTISDRETPYGDTFITRLIPIRYISASEISKSLKTLVSPNGTISEYGPTNTLIVTDSASNIRRLMKIIGKLDKEGSVEGVEVIPLKNASAQEVAQKLLSIFPQKREGSLLTKALAKRRGIQEPAVAQSISKIIPDDRTNSLIVVANRQGLERLLDIVKRLDIEVKALEGRGKIHVHYLEHADAEELAATLSSLSSGSRTPTRRPTPVTRRTNTKGNTSASSPVGATTIEIFEGEIKIAPDVATNSLVITASAPDYDALKGVISKLDIPRPQVFVEALIMEVSMTKLSKIGTAGSGGGQAGSANNPTTLFGATQLGGLSSLILNPAAATGLAVGFRSREISVPTGNGTSISVPIYGALFRAWQENDVFNIISTPNILTTDNKEAEIVIGKVVPVITAQQQSTTGTSNLINSISREKVATTLKVTPQINESDFVTLDIYQEISEVIGQSDTLGPTTSTRSAKTTVVVQDGQTVVIGGLIKDKYSKTVTKVPILGDIPLLGLLFRNTSKNIDKINLMIFITPHIIHKPMDLQRVTVEKNKQRRRFNRTNKVGEHEGVKKYGIDKTVDFNSVRPRKGKSDNYRKKTLRKSNPKQKKPQKIEEDSDGTEVDDPDVGTISKKRQIRSEGPYTEINMRPSRKTGSDDGSFFKEESTAGDFDDSDFISDDMLFNSVDNKPKIKKRKRRKSKSSNPFSEATPPSSE